MQQRDLSCLCRDEACDRIELHLAHEVTTVEPKPAYSRGQLPAWKRPAPKALDHAIAKATSKTYPRHFGAILQLVEADYGACIERTVHRRLKRLVQRGHILRIDLGRSLYAYLRPGSPMVNDIALMREQCFDAFNSSVPS